MLFVLVGCSSGGLGRSGSSAWHLTASPDTIETYYESREAFELCMLWDAALRNGNTVFEKRSHISKALRKKGERPDKCLNPERDDQIARDTIELEKAKTAARGAEAARQPIVIQQTQPTPNVIEPSSFRSCTSRGVGDTVYTNCY